MEDWIVGFWVAVFILVPVAALVLARRVQKRRLGASSEAPPAHRPHGHHRPGR